MTFLLGGRSNILAMAGLVAAASLGAQEPRRLEQSDSIPAELASALLSAGGLAGEPQFLVGALPGWIANRVYLPSGARVLGSAFYGNSVVGAITTSGEPEAVIDQLKRELPSRGWRPPPPPPSFGGGFRSPVTQNPNMTPTRITMCGDQQTLTATASRHRGLTELVIRATTTVATMYGICNPPSINTGPNNGQRAPLPTLYNPETAGDPRAMMDCYNSGGISNGTGTILRTPMTPDALLDHYGRQLQDSGWVAAGVGASMIGRTWTRADSAGNPLELTLTVTVRGRDTNCREMNLQVRMQKKP